MTSPLTVAEFVSRANSLHQAKQYAEALAYVTREGGRFPELSLRILPFQATMAAMTGQVELAVACLQTAIDRGQWYGERFPRNPELASLQGHATFERIVAICGERREAARAAARPQLYTEQPDPLPHPAPLLMVMHGNGGDGPGTLAQWRAAAQMGWLVAVAQSSQVEGAGQYVWNDAARNLAEMTQHFADLQVSHAVDPERVVLGGFSMGAGEVVHLAIYGQIPARGFIAVAPFVRDLDGLKEQMARVAPGSVRGYIITGDADFTYQSARDTVEACRAAGIPCALEEHPGLGHAPPAAFDQSLGRALRFILDEGPAAGGS
ncbi:MAG: alpha/beta hydrolase [Bacillota bacterium]